jgi:hypothetical protein
MRTKNSGQRVLDVEWRTDQWTPRVVFRLGSGIDRRCTNFEIVPSSSILLAMKPQKRRGSLKYRRDGSRPTWR